MVFCGDPLKELFFSECFIEFVIEMHVEMLLDRDNLFKTIIGDFFITTYFVETLYLHKSLSSKNVHR